MIAFALKSCSNSVTRLSCKFDLTQILHRKNPLPSLGFEPKTFSALYLLAITLHSLQEFSSLLWITLTLLLANTLGSLAEVTKPTNVVIGNIT